MIAVHRATPSDAAIAARLIYFTMGPLADYLAGLGNPARALTVLGGLFARPHNRFSYQFSDVVLVGGEVVGLLTSYPAEEVERLALRTGWDFSRILGLAGFLRFVWRSLPLAGAKETVKGEYFVHGVAVLPELRRQGIGSQLLSLAEARARQHGLDHCSLTVEVDNHAARQLYESLGYRVVDTMYLPRLQRLIGYSGWHRMAKLLA